MSRGTCPSCNRSIDAAAKLCPYCGADTVTGERVDTQAILQEVFHTRQLSTGESVLEFARQRQGIVLVGSLVLAFLVLAAIHQFITSRNATAVTNSPAVPLTEITDMANQRSEATPVPMPELDFPYEGRPQTWRTFIVERGAVAPAPPAPTTTAGTPAPAGAAPTAGAPAAGAAAAPRPGAPAPRVQQTPPPPRQ